MVGKVITKLGALLFFAAHHLRHQIGVLPQIRADLVQQGGIFSKTLHQDITGTIERRFAVSHAFFSIDIRLRRLLWILLRVLPQQIGQGLQPRFDSNLATGTAFRFVRQVQVFQLGFIVGSQDRLLQRLTEFALLTN